MPVKLPASTKKFCKYKILKNCTVKRAKHLAVAFNRRGSIITQSVNRAYEAEVDIPQWKLRDRFSLHAEESCIAKLLNLKAKQRFGEVYLLVARHRKGRFRNSRPCDDCATAISRFGFSGVYYTNDEGNIEKDERF